MARVGSRFKKIFEEAQQHPAYKKRRGLICFINLKAYKAPLKLKSLFFPIIHYEAIPHENPKDARVPKLKTVKAIPQCGDDFRECSVSLEIKSERSSEETKLLYEYEIVVFGLFKWTAEMPEDKEILLKSLAVTGASILYSSAREMLAYVSSRGPWGTCILPTISFIPKILPRYTLWILVFLFANNLILLRGFCSLPRSIIFLSVFLISASFEVF